MPSMCDGGAMPKILLPDDRPAAEAATVPELVR